MQLTNPALTADPDHICVCAAEAAQHGWRLHKPQESSRRTLNTARRLLTQNLKGFVSIRFAANQQQEVMSLDKRLCHPVFSQRSSR